MFSLVLLAAMLTGPAIANPPPCPVPPPDCPVPPIDFPPSPSGPSGPEPAK